MQKTEQRVRNAIEQLDGSIDAEVQKVEKQMEIIERGVKHTPAVAVDGDIETEGEVPGVEQLVEISSGDRRFDRFRSNRWIH